MTLRQYLREVGSYRDHLTEVAYLEATWDVPDRHDWYAMQVAAEIRRANVKEGSKIDTNDFKIKFKRKKSAPEAEKTMTSEERAKQNKMFWRAASGSLPPTTPQE